MIEEVIRHVGLQISSAKSEEEAELIIKVLEFSTIIIRKFTEVTPIYKESERGCVLVGTALLDQELERMLRCRFKSDGNLSSDDVAFLLSRGPVPPLRPFAMKIIYCRAFGLISEFERQLLDNIREMRNVCGHSHREVIINLDALEPLFRLLRENGLAKLVDAHTYEDDREERKMKFATCISLISALFCPSPDVLEQLQSDKS